MVKKTLLEPSKRFLSGILSAAMAVSLVSAIPGLGFATAQAADETVKVNTNVESLVSVKIGEKTYPMSLYQNDLYEAKVDGLTAGNVNATLVVDGEEQSSITDSAAIPDDSGSVYFQYSGGH